MTDVTYNYSLPVEVKSGNTTIGYTYDYMRRKIEVSVNGKQDVTYEYKDYTYNSSQKKCTFGEQTTTLYDGISYTTILQSKTGELDSASGRMKVTETTKINGSEKYRKEYDADGRLISVKNDGTTTSFTYNSYDKVTKASGGGLTENYTYNDYNLMTQKALAGTVSQTYSYVYKDNAARNLQFVSFGNYRFKPLTDVNGRNTGKEICYTDIPDDASSTDRIVAAEYITYRKVGDHATNMPATVWFGFGSQIKDSIKYRYDKCGNICEKIENGHIVAKYTYDSLNRLIREDNKAFGKTSIFTYDQNGNITERCEYDYTAKTGEELSELECNHYSYDYDGDKLVSYNNEDIVFENDILKKYRGNGITWQYGKRLTKYGSTEFTYDGLGRRISKKANGTTIAYTYDNNGRLIKQSDGLEFIYDNIGIVGVIYGGKEYFYRKDAQGNIIALIDKDKGVVVYYEYDAWGNHAVLDANGNNIESGIGALNPFRYRGYYYDTETKLYYLQTRYYDPEVGRFISQDSIEYADLETINGLNLYAYCGNNPVMNVDPTGEAWWNWLIIGIQAVAGVVACFVPGGQALGVSLLVGAAIGAITQVVAPSVAQVIGGATSISNGVGAFSTGISLLSAGPVGIIAGIALMAVGAATVAFGVNEVATGITGTNYIQKWTGMSDSAYGWTYAGLNIASSLGQLAGRAYKLYKTREPRFGHDNNLKGYRYRNLNGDYSFDFDYPHGNITKNHFHGIPDGNLVNRTGGHWNYLRLLLWMFTGR